jgi:hypothetical protein
MHIILRHVGLLVFLFWCQLSYAGTVLQRYIPAPLSGNASPGIWTSQPPANCPFKPSIQLRGIAFTEHAEYENADTWYPSWASDGNLYSPWTDGSVKKVTSFSGGKDATTGYAKISGDDPLHLTISDVGTYKSDPTPYGGRYPCGSLIYNGVWYYGTYCLLDGGNGLNWDVLGPFVGFRWSTDYGKSWTQTPCTPENPLFGEQSLHKEPIRIGSPHFVDFGENMEYSPDGYAYLVAHGASQGPKGRRKAYDSWITGDEIYMIRVKPSIPNMNDESKYQFFAGYDKLGGAIWSGDFTKIKPIASWKDHMGCVTMTYDPPLKKYLMCVTDGGTTLSMFSTYILESDRITGPWKLVSYLKNFGQQAYFVNIPSRFISSDGKTFWLCCAANFSGRMDGISFRSNPQGCRYGMCLQKVNLLGPEYSIPKPDTLQSPNNIAPNALLTVSSVHSDYSADGAVDRIIGGFPGDIHWEWASDGEKSGTFIRLTWQHEHQVNRVWLFDRPNQLDQILSGMLLFSDGTMIKTEALPDDAREGLEVSFKPKKIRWLMFIAGKVKPGSMNIGLSEIAVFDTAKR